MDEITIGDKIYISTKRAAKITGYTKDYVGQLCREGRVEARLVGRNWYVLETSIRDHRFGKEEEVAIEQTEGAVKTPTATWAAPVYKAEVPRLVPELTPKDTVEQAPAIAEMQSAWREWFESRPNGTTVTVQQYHEEVIEVSQEPEAVQEEASKSISEVQPSYEESVLVAHHHSEQEEQTVSVARIHAPEPAPASRPPAPVDMMPVRRPQSSFTGLERSAGQRSSVRAHSRTVPVSTTPSSGFGFFHVLLFIIAAVSVAVAVIGTGHANRFFSGTSIDFGFQTPVIEYLEGSRTYENNL